MTCDVLLSVVLAGLLMGETGAAKEKKNGGCFISRRWYINERGFCESDRKGIDCTPDLYSLLLRVSQDGDLVHRIHPDSGQCVQGQLSSYMCSLLAIDNPSTPRYSCYAALGENKYCIGPCPAPPGPNGCDRPTDYIGTNKATCTEVDGNAILNYEEQTSCPYGDFNNRLTYTNTNNGDSGTSCYAASCSGAGVETVVGAKCDDITGVVTRCWNQQCGGGGERQRQLWENHHYYYSALLLAPPGRRGVGPMGDDDDHVMKEGKKYAELATKCAHVHYDVWLLVRDHFYAIASPKEDRSAIKTATDCPVFLTEAQYTQDEAHYHKLIYTIDKQNTNNLVGPNSDSLFIGTFKLDDLRRAHESIDPIKESNSSNSNIKMAYDVITNNCAEFMLSLAAALNISIDAKITSYVSRRLIQESGKDLANKIRSSIHYASLLLLGGKDDRSLLRADKAEPSDEKLIQTLVEARAVGKIS